MKSGIKNELRLEFSSVSENESFARYAVSAFAAQLDPTLSELADIRTVVSEAVTNAIIHGYRGPDGKVTVTVKLSEDGKITIKVKDKGVGITDIEQAMQPLYTSDDSGERGGMGFAIMRSFTDRLNVKSKPGAGTTVTMVKLLGKKKA